MKQTTGDVVAWSVRLSHATLNLLRECERCFWLHLHGVRRPGGPDGSWPTITRGLDTVISHYCAPYRNQDDLPPLLRHLGGRLVTVRIGPHLDPDTGLTLVDRLSECLEVSDGLFAPLDHEVRGWAPNGVSDADQLQLDVYTLLLAENGYPAAGYGVLVYYVPMDGELHEGFPFRVCIRNVDTDAERARTWLRRARAVLDMPAPPEPSPDCAYCGTGLLTETTADKTEAFLARLGPAGQSSDVE